MKKPFIVANVREVLDLYDKEEISFSRMVEMLNEIAEKFYKIETASVEQEIKIHFHPAFNFKTPD